MASKRIGRGVGALGTAGILLLLGSGLAWAGPPNPTNSDANGNTAGGTNTLAITSGVSVSNTGFGALALSKNTTGSFNTANGIEALLSNVTGNYNTATGSYTLLKNTMGQRNTASGVEALGSNTMGNYNTADGAYALFYNETASNNTALGFVALISNTTGENNTASGSGALSSNTTGSYNTADGFEALTSNTRGSYNTAFGYQALFNNTSQYNTASGFQALFTNTGLYNTASGGGALFYNTTGAGNTAVGLDAGLSNTTGSANTFIGYDANANVGSYKNGTAIGAFASLTASNSIVLGNNAISTIYANVTSITAISDRRRKKDIRPLDADLGLDFIEKLKPVSYRFNNGDQTERYGFIAQDLEQALPVSLRDTIERSEPERGLALIERQNDKDRTYRISYGELIAPIAKSIQEQQREIEAVRQQNADLRQAIEDQAVTFKVENDALRHSIEAIREQVSAAR